MTPFTHRLGQIAPQNDELPEALDTHHVRITSKGMDQTMGIGLWLTR